MINSFFFYIKEGTSPLPGLKFWSGPSRRRLVWALGLAGGLLVFRTSSAQPAEFQRLGIEDGLSQSSINAIVQDRRGFMWFGTEDGLNRYDGARFRIFKHDIEEPGSLSFNHITCLYLDRTGTLWVGTNGGGLDRYDPIRERFIHVRHDPADPNSLSSDFVTAVVEDRSGALWIGTMDAGLNRLDVARRRLTRFRHSPADPASLGHDSVRDIVEDRAGTIWIGTYGGGLDMFDRDRGVFVHRRRNPANPSSLIDDSVSALWEDGRGHLWVGTSTGVSVLDRNRRLFTTYRHNPRDPSSLSDDDVNCLFEDSSGIVWVGTSGGLDEFDPNGGRFLRHHKSASDPTSLGDDDVSSLYEDRSKILWVGTRLGLNKLDKERKPFRLYRNTPGDPASLSDDQVMMIQDGEAGEIWIGTYAGGLNRFDRRRGTFIAYRHDPADPGSISHDMVMACLKDRAGTTWVGTYGGLDRFDPVFGRFRLLELGTGDDRLSGRSRIYCLVEDQRRRLWVGTRDGLFELAPDRRSLVRHRQRDGDPASLSGDAVFALLIDSSGTLWVGTQSGLNRLDPGSDAWIHYLHDPAVPDSLSHNEVVSLCQDRSGALWIGTAGGLNRLDRASGTFEHFREKDGLPNDLVYAILEDDRGRLWLSSNRGLSRFDPRTRTFRNYDIQDGLQGNEFNSGAALRGRNGLLYFGGINGLNVFNPEQIRDNPYPPEVVLTDLLISNRPVPIGPRGRRPPLLTAAISETNEIHLSQQERVITFEFAALHYAAPAKNLYAYKMEGFDLEWNQVGNRRYATYTALPAGSYVFHVKASNNDGVWNEKGAFLRVRVIPPWWGGREFRLLVLLMVFILLFVVYRVRTFAIRDRARALELRVGERTRALSATNVRLEREVAERRRTERALRESEDKFRSLAAQIPVGLYRTAPDGRFLYANPALAAILGYASVEDLMKIPITAAYVDPTDRARKLAHWKTRGGIVSSELRFKTRQGRPLRVRDTGSVIVNRRGDLEYISGIIEDITRQKRAEDNLKAALREKEVLLKEIHHRVKNNLQVISSLLRLQSRGQARGPAQEPLLASQARIRSMALVHESLYQSKDLARVDFAVYIRKLTGQLFSLYRTDPARIRLALRLGRTPLSINQAIPCGLIINELVSNALKHAFPGGRSGRILVELTAGGDGTVRLAVRDNGVGFPDGLDYRKTSSLGMQIVRGLVDQLGGRLTLDGRNGTDVVIVFPRAGGPASKRARR
jgi:PAS domain S-box-containing protein